MNWIGGARNRIKLENERKAQKDFFERRKLNHGSSLLHKNLALPRKRRLSQDLMALQTVNTFHSGVPSSKGTGGENPHSHNPGRTGYRAPIKAVDLDRFKSCTKQFKEVDIGPVSPTHAQSRLLLMDCKGDNLKKTSATETSVDACNKSMQLTDHFSSATHDEGVPNKKETRVKPDIRPFTFGKTCESNRTISLYSKPNPYVSENFPFTPLSKPETSKHKRGKDRNKRGSHATADKENYKSKDRTKRYMYTSTPYDAVLNPSFMDKHPSNQTLSLDLSPIGEQNISKTGSENSLWTSSATHTSQTNKLSIGAAGDSIQRKTSNEGVVRNQNESINIENHHMFQANNSNNNRQQSYLRQSAKISKYDFDPSSNASSNLKMTNDLLNLSESQYQSGLSLFKYAHAKKAIDTEKPSSLEKFRHQTSTPGILHQSDLCPYETPRRSLVLNKPNFQDFDEEFRFTPYKEISYHASQDIPMSSTPCKNPELASSSYRTPLRRVDISGQVFSSNDLRSRLTLCDTVNLIKEKPKQPDIMNLYREQKKTAHTRSSNKRSIQKEYSPKIADPFPSYLQTKNSDTSPTEKIQVIAVEDRNDEVSNLRLENHRDMTDVLKEMHEMETEENIQLEASKEKYQVNDDTAIYEEVNERTSMSFEADKYFESEEKEILGDRLAEIVEIQGHNENNNIDEHEINQQNIQNKEIKDTECEEYIAVAVDKSDIFSPDVMMEDNSKDETCAFETSQGFDVNTFCQYYPPADKIDELQINLPISLEKNLDDNAQTFSKDHDNEDRVTVEQSSKQSVDSDARSHLNKTCLGKDDGRGIEGKKDCIVQTSVLDKDTHKIEEKNIENGHHSSKKSILKDLDKDLELNDTKKADTSGNGLYQRIIYDFQHFKEIQTSESKPFNIHVLPTDSKVKTPNHLNVQDPEVSSGINRGIQCCIRQSVVDKGTSPIIMTRTNFTDIGVQCDGTFKKFGMQDEVELNNNVMEKLDSNSQPKVETASAIIKNISEHNKEE